MLLGLHRGVKMLGPEMRRRGEQHQVHVSRQHFLVSVKADKAVVISNLLLRLLGKLGAASILMVFQHVPQGHNFEVGSRLQEVQGSAGAPARRNRSGRPSASGPPALRCTKVMGG